MLSNLIAKRLDEKLGDLCKNRKIAYSRYADDILISGDNTIPEIIPLIKNIINGENFKINREKTRFVSQGSCQKAVGIVVNSKLSVGRERKRILRAIVHNVLKNGPITENKIKDPFFRERLFGVISYIINVEPELGKKLKNNLKAADWSEYNAQYNLAKTREIWIRSTQRISSKNEIDKEYNFTKNLGDQTDSLFFRIQLDKIFKMPLSEKMLKMYISEYYNLYRQSIVRDKSHYFRMINLNHRTYLTNKCSEKNKNGELDEFYFITKRDLYLRLKFGGQNITTEEYEKMEQEYINLEMVLGSQKAAKLHKYFKEKFGDGKKIIEYMNIKQEVPMFLCCNEYILLERIYPGCCLFGRNTDAGLGS